MWALIQCLTPPLSFSFKNHFHFVIIQYDMPNKIATANSKLSLFSFQLQCFILLRLLHFVAFFKKQLRTEESCVKFLFCDLRILLGQKHNFWGLYENKKKFFMELKCDIILVKLFFFSLYF